MIPLPDQRDQNACYRQQREADDEVGMEPVFAVALVKYDLGGADAGGKQ